jgi:hypothetical protein
MCQFAENQVAQLRNLRRRERLRLTLATVFMPVKAVDGAAANKAAQASFLRNIVRLKFRYGGMAFWLGASLSSLESSRPDRGRRHTRHTRAIFAA